MERAETPLIVPQEKTLVDALIARMIHLRGLLDDDAISKTEFRREYEFLSRRLERIRLDQEHTTVM